jgi:hypothetical protein
MPPRRADEVGDFRLFCVLHRLDMQGRLSIEGRSGLCVRPLFRQTAGTYRAPIGAPIGPHLSAPQQDCRLSSMIVGATLTARGGGAYFGLYACRRSEDPGDASP